MQGPFSSTRLPYSRLTASVQTINVCCLRVIPRAAASGRRTAAVHAGDVLAVNRLVVVVSRAVVGFSFVFVVGFVAVCCCYFTSSMPLIVFVVVAVDADVVGSHRCRRR